MGLPSISLEDGVLTKLEWLLVTWFVSEEEHGAEKEFQYEQMSHKEECAQ